MGENKDRVIHIFIGDEKIVFGNLESIQKPIMAQHTDRKRERHLIKYGIMSDEWVNVYDGLMYKDFERFKNGVRVARVRLYFTGASFSSNRDTQRIENLELQLRRYQSLNINLKKMLEKSTYSDKKIIENMISDFERLKKALFIPTKDKENE